MKLVIKPVINQKLSESIQYYIFCSEDQSEKTSYKTFPNTNLCLALYRSNKITHSRDSNFCKVEDHHTAFTSKLWGFHDKLFTVSIDGALDQVCILFHPSGLRSFTAIPYEVLVNSNNVFEMIFGMHARYFMDHLFEETDTGKRVALLEKFLADALTGIPQKHAVQWAIRRILRTKGDVKIESIANDLGINNATLYNNFIKHVGQGPKDFIRTVRFRSALSGLTEKKRSRLTDITYAANYFDQSHFIRECLQLTCLTPKELRNSAVIEQEELIWIIAS